MSGYLFIGYLRKGYSCLLGMGWIDLLMTHEKFTNNQYSFGKLRALKQIQGLRDADVWTLYVEWVELISGIPSADAKDEWRKTLNKNNLDRK